MRTAIVSALTAMLTLCGSAGAADAPFNPDSDPSRVRWQELDASLGEVPDVAGKSFGIVIKTPVNEYWRQMTSGYRMRAAKDGVLVDIQSAQSETDVARQLSIMHTMLGNQYDALLISPISSENLKPSIEDALRYGVPVIDVDGALADNVRYFVGPVNVEMGRRAARWVLDNRPSGGKVAVIEGQAGVLSTVQRSAGFRDTLAADGRFPVAGSVTADWDKDKAYAAATTLLKDHPDLVGIYCNNDTMALAAVDAVKALGKLDQVAVIGSDGTRAAYASIIKGELVGTVDIFPALIGYIGLEVAERVAVGQEVPRVVETPQMLVTKSNVARYDVPHERLLEVLLEDARLDAAAAP